MSAVQFNDQMFPLIVAHFPNDLTFDDVVVCNHRIGSYVDRKRPFVLVNNYGNANLTMEMQRHTDSYIRSNWAANRTFCMGVVAVTPSPLVRTVGKTFALVLKPPFPVVFCADMPTAYSKARHLIQEHQRHAQVRQARA